MARMAKKRSMYILAAIVNHSMQLHWAFMEL